MKSVYFLSDAHLGCRSIPHDRTRERRLVHFLDGIKDKASAVYLLGDIFDFWYEYKTVVPRGYTRFLGKLSELADRGVEVHFFTGNHDIWCGDYLVKECGVTLHTEPMTVEMGDKVFMLAHGDGLGDVFLHPSPLGCGFRPVLGGAQPPEAWRGRRRPSVSGRGQGVSRPFCQGIPESPFRNQLFHFRPSSHRAGLDADPFEPCPDSG